MADEEQQSGWPKRAWDSSMSNGNRPITVGLVALLLTVAGGAVSGYQAYDNIIDVQQETKAGVNRIERRLNAGNWSRNDHKRWAYRLRAENPEISIPNVDEVWKSGSRSRQTIQSTSSIADTDIRIDTTDEPESHRTYLTVDDVMRRENVDDRDTIYRWIEEGRIQPQPQKASSGQWVIPEKYRIVPETSPNQARNGQG